MSTSSPVYQLTTVSYASSSNGRARTAKWTQCFQSSAVSCRSFFERIGDFCDDVFNGSNHSKLPIVCLICGLIFLAIGSVIFLCGLLDYEDAGPISDFETSKERSYDTISIVSGLILLTIGIFNLVYCLYLVRKNDAHSSIKEPLTLIKNNINAGNVSAKSNRLLEKHNQNEHISLNMDESTEKSHLMKCDLKDNDEDVERIVLKPLS